MTKTILLTGATDGIGLVTAKMLAAEGYTLLLHGRSAAKLEATVEAVSAIPGAGVVKSYRADLTNLSEVAAMIDAITKEIENLDVLINNAGVFKMSDPRTPDGFDARFVVNTIAPYLLTRRLLGLMTPDGRVLNLSSAAQAPVDIDALNGSRALSDSEAYAQSKLAITMWSFDMAHTLGANGPAIIAVNPASFLGSKMVKEAYGHEGHDLRIGAEILRRASLEPEFATASGRYFDNDSRRFANPHPDAMDRIKTGRLVAAVEDILARAAQS